MISIRFGVDLSGVRSIGGRSIAGCRGIHFERPGFNPASQIRDVDESLGFEPGADLHRTSTVVAHADHGLLRIEFADAGNNLTHRQMVGAWDRGALDFPGFPNVENKRHRVGGVFGAGNLSCQFSGADLVHGGVLKRRGAQK